MHLQQIRYVDAANTMRRVKMLFSRMLERVSEKNTTIVSSNILSESITTLDIVLKKHLSIDYGTVIVHLLNKTILL